MALPSLPSKYADWTTWGTAVHAGVNGAAVVADIGVPGTATGDALSASLVPRPSGGTDGQALIKSGTNVQWGAAGLTAAQIAADATVQGSFIQKGVAGQQKVGNGADPNTSTTQDVKLLVTANRTNPDKVIEQHFVGYSFYSGTPQPGVGTLQGGSCESYAFANGSADMGTVLGFEGVGRGDGDNATRKIGTIIGCQGTALNRGVVNVDMLVGVRARGVSGGGTGTVTETRSLDVQEPTIGTTKYSAFITGRTRMKRSGSGGNTLELVAATDAMSWSWAGQVQQGYASNGSSIRVTLDAQDTPTAGRFKSELFGSGKHLSLLNSSSEVFAVAATGILSLTTAGTTGIKTVEVGAVDSGGTGYRMLRVTN